VVRRSVTLACVLFAGAASAESARVRWRGVTVEGRAPAALPSAVAAHVAISIKQLGSTMVTTGPADVDVAARCRFVGARAARCVVQVTRAAGGKAERRAEVRYRDAEDLAESLALLISDTLTAEFPDIVGAPRAQAPTPPPPAPPTPPPAPTPTPTPAPVPPAPSPPTAAEERAHQEEMARQLELVKQLQREADDRAAAAEQKRVAEARRAEEKRAGGVRVRGPRVAPPTRIGVEAGSVGVFGASGGDPPLVGGQARVVWTRGLLRTGASLSLAGMRDTLEGHDLTFFRALVAARVGLGVRNPLLDLDLTAGPALLVLLDDAHAEGRHAMASFVFVVGPRLSLTLGGPIALVIGADLDVVATDEKVVSGNTEIAQFSHVSVEVTLGLAWRNR
jgi:hypothetical protein